MPQKITIWLKNNFALLLIIIFFLSLALYHFFSQGLINWDEAYFVVTTETYANIFRTVLSDPLGLFTNASFFHDLLIGYNNVYTAARPAYIVPAAVINLIWPNEFSTKILSLLSGILGIIFFYRLLDFYPLGKKTKLAATFLLAVSPLYLIYSRLGLSQIFSSAILLAVFFYLLKFKDGQENSYLKLTAIALAVFMMSHYNCLPLTLYLLALVALILIKNRQKIKKYFIFSFYFLLLPVIWEIITRLGAIIASAKHIAGPKSNIQILSYFQEISTQLGKAGAGSGIHINQIFYYPRLLFSTEGLIFSSLFLTGLLIATLNYKKFKYSFILTAPLLHFTLFSLINLKFPRNLVTILPALYIFAALGLGITSKFLSPRLSPARKKIALIIFCFLIIFFNAGQYKNILNIKTNFPETADFIKNNYSSENIGIFSNSAQIWKIYLKGYVSETPTKIEGFAKANPNKKIIFIDDYFSTVHGGVELPPDFSRKKIKELTTNIFQTKPVALDFIYQSEKATKKMFAENRQSPIIVYELIPK